MTPRQSGDATITQGIVLSLVGLATMAFAYFVFEAGVDAPFGDSAISNLDLMQRQMMIFHAGSILLLIGGVLVAAGLIIRAIAGDAEEEPPRS